MNANMVWRNQKLEYLTEPLDRTLFDMSSPLLKVSDRNSEATIFGCKAGRYGYMVHVRLPDISYDVLATREIDALDAFQNFLPLLEMDVAKHVWAMLRANQIARRTRQT